jgi:hypothetical protein
MRASHEEFCLTPYSRAYLNPSRRPPWKVRNAMQVQVSLQVSCKCRSSLFKLLWFLCLVR